MVFFCFCMNSSLVREGFYDLVVCVSVLALGMFRGVR